MVYFSCKKEFTMAAEKSKQKRRPTAEKRITQNVKANQRNRAFMSRLRTAITTYKKAVAANEESEPHLRAVYSFVDKAVKRGLYKQNKASRTKSRMAALASKA